jgi:hypothetical protein
MIPAYHPSLSGDGQMGFAPSYCPPYPNDKFFVQNLLQYAQQNAHLLETQNRQDSPGKSKGRS